MSLITEDITMGNFAFCRRYITKIHGWAKTALLLCMIGMTISISAGISSANAQSSTSPTTILSPELQITSLEQHYDQQVINILSNYFDRKHFFVNVIINAQIVEENYQTTQNRVNQSSSNFSLPGLPFLPSENMRSNPVNETKETVISENKAHILRIRNVRVNIQADSSLTNEQIAFMKEAAETAVKANPARGDSISITQIPMPDFDTGVANVAVQQNNDESASRPLLSLSSLNQYLPGIIILLVVIGIITFVSQWYRRSQKGEQSGRSQRQKLKSQDAIKSSVNASINELQQNISHQSGQQSELDLLIQKFFDYPKEIALIFESWMEENKAEGSTKAAKIISTVDKELLKSLKPELNAEYYTAIEEAANNLDPMTLKEKEEVIGQFNSLFDLDKNSSKSKIKRQQLPLFKFLDYLPERRILELLNSEDNLTSSLIIDYLPEQRAASLLNQLDDNQATNIMVTMTKIRELSYKEQKAISSRLFAQNIDWLERKREQEIDAQNVLTILEHLPLRKQQHYVQKFKENNGAASEYIQDAFVSLDDIPKLNDQIIKSAARAINTETLIDALIGLDQSIVDKVLSVRPTREQHLIRTEIEETGDEDQLDTEYAKSRLMKSIREAAKNFNA